MAEEKVRDHDGTRNKNNSKPKFLLLFQTLSTSPFLPWKPKMDDVDFGFGFQR
jgi:hypothetical protein